MKSIELQKIAHSFVSKGYADGEKLRYSDDLYDASGDEKDECLNYLDECLDIGLTAFESKYLK